ncbi:uncharacterized protein STEHIDRAFT_162565 [Stereum hirsutum FP-91666 SS1]|uniref:uncharacterized protein n=1 Tax=Stereum hirsutum (strain FP-91666) TaxID=721885 RepID=UPI00044499BC|nr:uncharacterized protein STEHIDRAFT_162565 [Stereum hirsutum FP-91666 SS1]EIM80797.1 hypothetical protein STEHIDRAFT_162565 [Stereum hirsutum FP-91666 SS1]
MSTNVRTLRSCALVCKDWTPAAQRILFHRITTRINVFSQKSILDLDRFLTQQLNIGNRILSLDLSVAISPSDTKPKPKVLTLSVTTLEQMLSHCPYLYHLGLNIDTPSFEEDEVARLSALPVKVRSLDVIFRCDITKALAQLFFIWPTIRHFSYRNPYGMEMTNPAEVLPERPPFSLYELSLHSDPDRYVLDWLVPPPNESETNFQPSLRILEASMPMVFDDSQWDYKPFAPFLLSLRLSHPPQDGLSWHVLDAFNNLEELVLRDCLAGHWTIRALPPTLKHYRYHRSGRPEVKKARALLLAHAVLLLCPKLEMFTMNYGPKGPYREVFRDFEKLCAGRKIAFNVDPRIHLMSDYPVPVDRFPRLRTVDNLYQMKRC